MHSNFPLSPLRKCLLGLALLVFLTGTFHEGIFEIAHTLSHQFKGGHSYHSHSNLEDTDHKHVILDISKMAFEKQNDSPISQDNQQKLTFDKTPQTCGSVAFQINLTESKNKKILFPNLQLPATPALQINVPPPDFST